MAMLVMFHAMADRVASFHPLKFDISRSQSQLRIATTAAPISAAEIQGEWADAPPAHIDSPLTAAHQASEYMTAVQSLDNTTHSHLTNYTLTVDCVSPTGRGPTSSTTLLSLDSTQHRPPSEGSPSTRQRESASKIPPLASEPDTEAASNLAGGVGLLPPHLSDQNYGGESPMLLASDRTKNEGC
eukprot:3936969-Rhodomonas_salina.2